MKKIVLGILSIAIVFGIASCDGGGGSTGSTYSGDGTYSYYFEIENLSGFECTYSYTPSGGTITSGSFTDAKWTSPTYEVTLDSTNTYENLCITMTGGGTQCGGLTAKVYVNGTLANSQTDECGSCCTSISR